MNKIPRNTFVLNIAKISNPLEIFFANIWVIVITNKVHLDLLICFLQYSMASSLLSLVDDFCV